MHQTAYYTGSFDPIHSGHIWTIKVAYKTRPFKKLILGVGYGNPKKPKVTSLEHRMAMIQAALAATTLPFVVEVLPFDYQKDPAIIRQTIPTDSAIRILGSDSIITFIAELQTGGNEWGYLLPFHHVISIRDMANVGANQVHTAIATLPPTIRSNLSYEIAGTQSKPVESSDIRPNVDEAYTKGLITKEIYDYIKQHSLYSQTANSELQKQG